ncbi:hypothetical protein PQQ99_07805 [Paraburkholderia sediminicola]|uniref:hypothetical protein n=1 Tax=Paraburkholderia sediminicola TaxID=458836 RepID=UPI0038B9F5CD
MLTNNNAFARAKMMMTAIAAAMSLSNEISRQAMLAKIGPYVSRGKGSGKTSPSRHCAAMDMDVLYGWASLYRELAVRVAG